MSPCLDVLGDEVRDGAGTAGCSVPAVHALPDVAVLVHPALVRRIFYREQHISDQLACFLTILTMVTYPGL